MKKWRFFFGTLLVLFSIGLSLATEPKQWTISTQREFLEGDLKGVSVTSDGKIVVAPALETVVDTEETFVYSAVADSRGNLYLGTGSEGKIYRRTTLGEASQWADLDESSVYALAVAPGNRTYAATSPDGKVYRLDSQGGESIFFDPAEKYIWALAVDAQNNLFVGTGPKGVIYKVDPEGQSSTFYDSQESHIVSLGWDLDGNLLAGSAPNGLLFRVSTDGSPFVIHDASLEEIKSMVVDRYGNIYAAALSRPGGPTAESSQADADSSGTTVTSQKNQGTGGQVTVRVAGSTRGNRLEIFKVDRENLVDTLYTSNDEVAYDLLLRNNGDLLVATGNKGRIISISPRRFVTFLAQSPEHQVTQLLEMRDRVYAATSNLGRVFELSAQPSAEAVYESKVLDAGMLSSWGMIRWNVVEPTSAPVSVYTRSGNTQSTDQTWNDWDGPYTEADGSYVKSPPARFLQWKIEFPQDAEAAPLTSRRNAVEAVGVAYMQRNMAPQTVSITVHPPGLAFLLPVASNPGAGLSPGGPDQLHLRSLPRSVRQIGRTSGVTPPPRRIYAPGARTVSWTAKDSNGDDLIYSLYYQSQGDTSWKLLKEELTHAYYTIDGVSFPDGVYVARVVASDAPNNPASQALESEILSKPFVIANSSPSVESQPAQVSSRQVSWRFTARTGESAVYQVEYSVDGGEWGILFPQDGIADSSSEHYELVLDDVESGQHVITVRVVDTVGNMGTGKTTVSIQ